MLPGLMLAVALTSDPAVVAAWPVSDLDAELAVTEAELRALEAECLAGAEFFQREKARYAKTLADSGERSEAALKVMAALARRHDSCRDDLNRTQNRLTEIQKLRAKERKLRAERPEEKR